MKTKLTPEESACLIKLGVDPKLASKCDMTMKIGAGVRGIIKRPDPKPIFELSDILSILPKEIVINGEKDSLTMGMDNEWCCAGYMALDVRYYRSELIDSLYQLLIWYLTEFKKKGYEQARPTRV